MRFVLAASLAALFLRSTAALAQVPATELAQAPADARQFTVVSVAGRHGSMQFWTTTDGVLMGRMSVALRGQVWEQDEATRLGADGAIAEYRLRGTSPDGDVAESFRVADGAATWKSPIDAGSVPYTSAAFYLPAGWTIRASYAAVERLVASRQDVALLPGGRAHIEQLTSVTVTSGNQSQTLTAWVITGFQGTPYAVWTDAQGSVFADVGGLSLIRAGFEHALPTLQAAQDEALAKQAAALARTLAVEPPVPVAFVDVRAFVDGRRFAEHQTVVVRGSRIAAVGRVGKIAVPPGAQVVDGNGMTLLPGLWDSHMHVGDDYTGVSELALGVTSARDPGNNDALTIARRQRRAAGELLSPTVYASSMIDGRHETTAQLATVVTSRAEAIQAVEAAKAKGQSGVKFYGSLDPAWVAPAAARAHRLGLHVHGHVPAGMRPRQAIAAGYDEITHINFVAMEAMPQEVVAHSNGIARMLGVGTYAKDMKLDAEPMASLISTMAARRIAVDPTLVVFEGRLSAERGDLSPAYAAFVGALPPAVERSFRQGGLALPAGLTREDFRASFRKLQELVRRLHHAGVPIVAGTDGSGMELVRELELYVDAGLTPAQALATATIVPARLVGAERRTGSIVVGKAADLVLVEGDPSRRIGDLRHTRLVMMGGKLMEADRLRAAAGFSKRPAYAVED